MLFFPLFFFSMDSSWSDLPTELLGSIVERLPLADRARFSAVCPSWRSAAAVARQISPPAPQSPWLMLPFSPRLTPSRSSATFFSFADRKAYRLTVPSPPISDRLVIGSSFGWLITADADSELHLVNPLTGDQISLPSVTTFPSVEAVRGARGRVAHYTIHFADDIPPETCDPAKLRYFFEKAVLSAPPVRSSTSSEWGGYTVMLIHNPLFQLALARAGEEAWTCVETPSLYWVDAIVSSGGQFLTLESEGRVEAWDIGGARPGSALVAPGLGYSNCSKYLVELPATGQLIQVRRWREPVQSKGMWEPRPQHVESVTTRVDVFRLKEDAAKGIVWVKDEGESLREFALFLGKNTSMCVPARECAELRGNCIYFTDDESWSHEKCHEVIQDVGVFDIKEKKLKPCGGYDFSRIWPPPTWIMPTVN